CVRPVRKVQVAFSSPTAITRNAVRIHARLLVHAQTKDRSVQRHNEVPTPESMKIKAELLSLAVALSCGCITTNTGQKIPDPAVLMGVAQNAAAVGSQLWLQGHPQDKPQFVLAQRSLSALIATGNGNPADLQAA